MRDRTCEAAEDILEDCQKDSICRGGGGIADSMSCHNPLVITLSSMVHGRKFIANLEGRLARQTVTPASCRTPAARSTSGICRVKLCEADARSEVHTYCK